MKNLVLVLSILISLLVFSIAAAQTETEEVLMDENVEAQDLEVQEPTLLPDNLFYFVKNWSREIQAFFTFDAVKKAELREKFANEKLMELNQMIERNRNANALRNAARNYEDEVNKMKAATERIRETAQENERVGKFLDKFIQHQALHQIVLQKLEAQVPEEVFEKIQEVRENHLEKFGEVMQKLEDKKEQLQERLENNLEEIKGSQYKNFKNLEILLQLEEKVTEQAKEAIRGAQENALKRLKGDFEQMSPEDQEKFEEYLEGTSGKKEIQLEILENLGEALKAQPIIRENLIQARERVLEQVQVQERARERNCPEIEKPASDFCKDGRIIIKKDDNSCIVSYNCVIPAEIEILPQPSIEEPSACITLWDPVCGKDGKTYSNACFAKLANVEVDYKGECKETECKQDSDCPQPRCGAQGTISARCIGAQAKCVQGKCQIISSLQAIPSNFLEIE